MRDAYHEVLDSITGDLVEMTRLASTALSRATEGLLKADRALTENVIAADEAIDAMEKKVNVIAVDTLARQQPVATDLRTVVTALRMGASIERMGDLAAHIAKIARLRYPNSAVPENYHPAITEMAQVAGRIADEVAQIIASTDASRIGELDQIDDRLDTLNRELFARASSEDADFTREAGIDLVMLARFYERFGDHAISVARSVAYLVTGELHLHDLPE